MQVEPDHNLTTSVNAPQADGSVKHLAGNIAGSTEQAKIFELTNDPKTQPKAERAALARRSLELREDMPRHFSVEMFFTAEQRAAVAAALARFERLLDDDRDEDGEVWDE